MKKLLFLVFIVCGISQAQYIVRYDPSEKFYVSFGANKSVSRDTSVTTGTFGLHYFPNDYIGASIQTNLVNELGYYLDFTPIPTTNIKLIVSVGQSAKYNCFSYALHLCIRLRDIR